jgi:hypothetical protein
MANEFQRPMWPNLQIPDGSTPSLQKFASAVVQTLQMLTQPGQKTRSGSQPDMNAQHTFVQGDTPQAMNSGDFWVATKQTGTGTGSLNYWDGSAWRKIVDLP